MADATSNKHENYKPSVGPIVDILMNDPTNGYTKKGTMAAIVQGKAVRAASHRRVGYVVSTYRDPNDSTKYYARIDTGGCAVRGIFSGVDASVLSPNVAVAATDNQTFGQTVFSGTTACGRATEIDPNDSNQVWVQLAPLGS